MLHGRNGGFQCQALPRSLAGAPHTSLRQVMQASLLVEALSLHGLVKHD